MALKIYRVVVGDQQVEVKATSARVAINRSLSDVFADPDSTTKWGGRRDRQLLVGKTLVVTCHRVA